ncbi:MAG: NAD-binding protein [Myxococcaceae bacterium]|nr:NAD-binding protein [Myxococcaceae bacterium]
MRAPTPTLARRARYFRVVLQRFRMNLVVALLLFGGTPLLYVLAYRYADGSAPTYGRALQHVYFLLFGQPTLELVDDWRIIVLNLLIPPVGIGLVVDGIVRFAYLFFAKHRADKEWIELVADSMRGHVIVCGAGRIGYRVTCQLLKLKREVVVVEKRQDAPFVAAIRDLQVPLLIDDIRAPRSLERLNVAHAEAVVCATDDDLTNLNVALDARRLAPHVRVVMRLFDEDLVERVRENFHAEAHSTSALAAHTLALSALDPRIVHSFPVDTHLMVVSRFLVGEKLTGMKVSELRDRFGALTLSRVALGNAEQLHPPGPTALAKGDTLTLQCAYQAYLALREFTGEAHPPLAARG